MSSNKKEDKRVEISFTNWVLGGSLVSISSAESRTQKRKSISHNAIVTEVDANGNKIVVVKEDAGANSKVEDVKKDKKVDDRMVFERPKMEVKVCKHKKCEKCGKLKRDQEKSKEAEEKKDKEVDKKIEAEKDKDEEKENSDEKKGTANDFKAKPDEPKTDDLKNSEPAPTDSSSNKYEMSGGLGASNSPTGAKDNQNSSQKNNSAFSATQDRKIMEMKAANKSWKEICTEIGLENKHDVIKRFKELNSGAATVPLSSPPSNTSKDGEKQSEEKEKGRAKEKEVESGFTSAVGGSKDSATDSAGLDFSNLFDDIGNGGAGTSSGEKAASDSKDDSDSFWNRDANATATTANTANEGGAASGNDLSWNQPEKASTSICGHAETGGCNSNTGSGTSSKQANRNQQSQHSSSSTTSNSKHTFLDKHSSSSLSSDPDLNTAPTPHLIPTAAFPPSDCQILEYLHAQYEEHKWLHIQAGFFNWTGRMVVAEILEGKFREDGLVD